MLRRSSLVHHHHVSLHVAATRPIQLLPRRFLFNSTTRTPKSLHLIPSSPSPFQFRQKGYIPPPKASLGPPSLEGRSIFRDTSKEKGANPLWYILAALITAVVFTFLEKRRRGLGIIPLLYHELELTMYRSNESASY